MYDAFISYRRCNGFMAAKVIREMLKAKGVTAYMDLDELHSGTFDDKLLDAIHHSPVFILVLSPGALDNCGNSEDWLTKEIVAAMDFGSKIIPVLCEDFQWPTQWADTVPRQVRDVASYHGLEARPTYIDAMIDKIVEEVRGKDNGAKSDLGTFFRNRMAKLASVKGVDIAFHSGSAWLSSAERMDILVDLAETGIPMRIVVNSPEAAESIGKHMRHKIKKYMPFAEAIDGWRSFDEMYENVQVRVSDIPLLRVYYAFTMENEADSAVRVKYYTYGNAQINKNFAHNFEPQDACYSLYKAEFEFLWERGTPAV